MPYYPQNSGDKAYYTNNSSDIKLIIDYAKLSYIEVKELDILTYWGLLHDAVVYGCSRTPEGREYLENAWLYEQTEPDRDALRAISSGGERKWLTG